MEIDIEANGIDLTPPLREYIELKIGSLEKFLKRFSEEGSVYAKVEVARTTQHHHSGNVFYAEVNLYIQNKILRAEYTSDDIRAAIDKVKDKLKREIQKHKITH
jgi:putative sigma-54 modulation protein